MEESVSNKSNEIWFSFLFLRLMARGQVAFILASAVAILIIALASRIVL
jgi:hypothetical protein